MPKQLSAVLLFSIAAVFALPSGTALAAKAAVHERERSASRSEDHGRPAGAAHEGRPELSAKTGAGFENLKSLAVYAGAREGTGDRFVASAQRMGEVAASHGITLVTGAGGKGLMGAVTDGALKAGGKVIGVTTPNLHDREGVHPGLSELVIVKTQGERKENFLSKTEAGLALPGGIGTLGEFAYHQDTLQIGEHMKPVALDNSTGFYNNLERQLDTAVKDGFLSRADRDKIIIDKDPVRLLHRLDDKISELKAAAEGK